jgi:hypothetical protein
MKKVSIESLQEALKDIPEQIRQCEIEFNTQKQDVDMKEIELKWLIGNKKTEMSKEMNATRMNAEIDADDEILALRKEIVIEQKKLNDLATQIFFLKKRYNSANELNKRENELIKYNLTGI